MRFRNHFSELLHYAAIRADKAEFRTVWAIYMVPASLCFFFAKNSDRFGITENMGLSLAVAGFIYMSMPACLFLVFNFVEGDARFRMRVILAVIAIVVTAVVLAFWLAYLVPMP